MAIRAEDAALSPGLLATYSDADCTVLQIAPTPNFLLNDKQSIHPALAPKFKAEWSGLLKILRRGEYTLSTAGAEARILLDGKEVQGKPVELAPGQIPLQIFYESKGGISRLQLLWQSSHFKLEPVPSNVLYHRNEPEKLASFQQIERGRALVEELNCTGCHAPKSKMPGRRGPDLSTIGSRATPQWIYKWLENPQHFRAHAVMPAMQLSDEERRDVATFLGGLKTGKPEEKQKKISAEHSTDGKKRFEQVGCIACHHEKGISLAGIGSKMTSSALASYILDPLSVDPSGRMPALFEPKKDKDSYDALLIAEYLVQSKNPEFEKTFPEGDSKRGEAVIRARGCVACHTVNPDIEARMAAMKKTMADLGLQEQSPWKVIGPFSGSPAKSFPPEQKLDLNAEYDGANGQKLKWKDAPEFVDGKRHNLFGGLENATAYLTRTVTASKETYLTAYMGSDDTVTLWVNGEKAYESMAPRGMPEEKDRATIKLNAGTNTLLMKIGNFGGGWEFFFRLAPASEPFTNTLAAPPFEKLAADKGCLSENPAAGLPRYGIVAAERASIGAYLASQAQQPDRSPAPVHEFYRTVSKLNCTACHELNGSRPAAEMSEAAPVMTLMGDKLRVSWLDSVLNQRVRSRGWMHLKMPHFGKELTAALPQQFAAMAGAELSDPPLPPAPSLDQIRTGITMFGKDKGGMACISCHDYQDHKAAGDIRGIDLTMIASRIRPDWFQRWMRDPARIQPGTAMPQFFTDMPENESHPKIDLLWKTLALGRAMPQPAGLEGQKSLVMVVKDEPVIVRGFLPGSSLRSIAVGLPGFISYVFDAEQCQLRYAWLGGFLDMSREWTERGGGPPQPLGRKFYTSPAMMQIRVGKAEAEVPAKFLGYKVVKGLPIFQYALEGVTISEQITNPPDSLGLVRTFELSSPDKDVFFVKGEERGVKYSSDKGEFNNNVLKIPAAQSITFSVTILVDERKAP
ncbi:MAG TPA: c-type cytochrome [Planctomycetota bacterium]|nr:c-type cytochrome [Planctomycetota bacterium]